MGGGIFIEGDFAAGSTESAITDSEITDNVTRVKGGGTGTGGGLYARDPISIARAEISSNRADEGGGLTLTQSLESAVINDLTLSGNRAARGAGVNVSTDDPVSFTNTTISENKVTKGQGRGGGALYTTFGEIDLTNVTIADNISGKRKAIALKPTGPNFVTVDIRASVVDGPKKDCKGNDHFGIRAVNVFGDTSCTPPGDLDEPGRRPEAQAPRPESRRVLPQLLRAHPPAQERLSGGRLRHLRLPAAGAGPAWDRPDRPVRRGCGRKPRCLTAASP